MYFYNLPLGRMEALPFHAVASSRASTLPAGASLLCLFAVINFCLFIYWGGGVGATHEPTGSVLCKQKEQQLPPRPHSPPRRAPRGGDRLTHRRPVRLELVCSLRRLGLQRVLDSGRAFLSSSLPARWTFTKAQDDNEVVPDILMSLQGPSQGLPGHHQGLPSLSRHKKEWLTHHTAQGCSSHVLQSPGTQGFRTVAMGRQTSAVSFSFLLLVHALEKSLESANQNNQKLLVQVL